MIFLSLHRWLLLCASLFFAINSCSPKVLTAHPVLKGRTKPAVLFIGNSYSFGVPKEFQKLAAKHGVTLEVAQSTHSGRSLARHAYDAETLKKIRARRWDVIVLQEFSRTPSLPIHRDLLMFPAVKKLAAEARRQGAIPVLYQTWGWRYGDPKKAGDHFIAMNHRVRQGYALAAQKAGALQIVPVGDAWQREWTAGRGTSLFMPDGRHPSPRGIKLAAEIFYTTLFGRTSA